LYEFRVGTAKLYGRVCDRIILPDTKDPKVRYGSNKLLVLSY